MSKAKESKPKKISRIIQDSAGIITAITVIVGALLGAGQWIVHQVSASTNSRIDSLESKIDDNRKNDELATTRLELMVLIEHDPDNVVEIEKLARHYFLDLKGNSYLTSVFSKWCIEHELNCAEIVIK